MKSVGGSTRDAVSVNACAIHGLTRLPTPDDAPSVSSASDRSHVHCCVLAIMFLMMHKLCKM